jgi:hypothetical protein
LNGHRARAGRALHSILTFKHIGRTHMPKVSDMIVSKFLRKEDCEDEIIVTAKAVTQEDMPGDAGGQRWVLSFKELEKGLVLNTTAIRVLEKAFGSDSDDWIGKRVVLYADPNVSFKGQVVGGLRLRPVKTPAPAKPKTAASKPKDALKPEPSAQDTFDEDIP